MRLLLYLLVVLLTISSASALEGTTTLLTVVDENATIGGTASVKLEIREGSGRIFIDSFPLNKIDTQISVRFAKDMACDFLELDCSELDFLYTIRSNSGIVGGPSAGGALTVLTAALLDGQEMNPDVAMTGTINSGGTIGAVGGTEAKARAAALKGIKKVLIPEFSAENVSVNETEIIRVSEISEALYHFTEKNYTKKYYLQENEEYNELMKGVSERICGVTDQFFEQEIDEDTIDYNASLRFRNFSIQASEKGEYYSAASFCFSANIRLRRLLLENEENLLPLLEDLIDQLYDFDDKLSEKELEELTELETYMIVKERIDESLETTKKINKTNISVAQLGYAIERYNSAVSWAVFFDLEGKKVDLDEEHMERACYNKLDEVEERLNLVKSYASFYDNLEAEEAKTTAANSDFGLCLFRATKAKAEINAVIDSIAVNQSKIEDLIRAKLELAENAIAKQQGQGSFPILAYSYLVYADDLIGEDNTNALIFSEYALEFSDLDMYFPQELEKVSLPEETEYNIWLYILAGFIGGMIFHVILFYIFRKKPGRNPPKKISPRKKR